MTGILLQWYLHFPIPAILISSVGFAFTYFGMFLFSPGIRFRLQPVQGVLLNLLLICAGLLITWHKDIKNSDDWYGKYYQEGDLIVVRLDEPLVQKLKSDKANGFVEAVIHNNEVIKCKGKILVYFSKEPAGDSVRTIASQLQYGDKILISKKLLRIKNTGNPGAFNYERYAAFQQIFHNVFLNKKDWIKLDDKNANPFKRFIFTTRDNILAALRKNISSGSDELGLAEALLIGYTNDLDKDLVQAYSNTGVVHIIAISGMHLALIYLLLVAVFAKIPLINKSKLLQVLMILTCLWLFSLLTGAAASVIRAAVMFTFITIGTNIKRKSSIYNSLAASAFVILSYNPYFLWDVGFQLSYLAVISIIIFQKPVYNCLYVKNKWAEKVWELVAISLSAQILTFPICIYYFHQFPNYFLLTNIIAVPLSSIILYAEIALIIFAWVPYAGPFIGKIVTWLVWLMNKTIVVVNGFPFAVWEAIPSTLLSTWILYVVVICFSVWAINKKKSMFRYGIISSLAFVMVYTYEDLKIKGQQKMVVYNISQHAAIDFINGNDFKSIGDSSLLTDPILQNYNLKPAHVALQLTNNKNNLKHLFQQKPFFQFHDKKILLIENSLAFVVPLQKTDIDIIVISKNPALKIAQLAIVFNCGQYIFDASNSLWKIDKWRKECEELHLRSYSVSEKGAFVMDVK